MSEQKHVYILLLGQSGVGKTCTINSFAQILSYLSLDQALEAREPIVLVPLRYNEIYPDGSSEEISYNGAQIADADNERGENVAFSCTQAPRMYSFKCADQTFNFIDMPGFGDTDGYGEDELLKKKRYAFLEQIPQIHAIVAVVKANENRMSPALVAALDDVLTMVPKAATANLIFFNTHAYSTNFQGGAIQTSLTEYLNGVNVKYGVNLSYHDNVFFVDNFGLLHLLSYSKSEKYRLFKAQADEPIASKCWQKTTEAFYAMTRKVLTLPGIPSTGIATINFARTVIEIVVRLLIEASDTVLKFDDPEVREQNIQSARRNPAMRGKTDKQISDYISIAERQFKNGLLEDYAAASKALLKPAGFLKHHSVAPLSNGYRIRLQNHILRLENQADYDGAEHHQAELERRNAHYRCIELILENADKISTLRETLAVPQELLMLRTIGRDIEKAFREHSEAVKFEFEDTVSFKARYPIQNQIHN